MTSRDTLVSQIREVAYLEGDFTTRAGQKTDYYIDKYQFETRPEVLGPLAKAIAAQMPDPSTYDRIAAPELGAVALAAVVSLEVQKPFFIVKKQAKEYGTQKLIEGDFVAGDRCVVVEDILTTGGAALRACDIVEAEGMTVQHIVGVVNREEGAEANVAERGYPLSWVLSTSDLKQAAAA